MVTKNQKVGLAVGIGVIGTTALTIALASRAGAAGGGGGAISGFSMPAQLQVVSVNPVGILDYQNVTLATTISNLGGREEAHQLVLTIDQVPEYAQIFTVDLKPKETYPWSFEQWVRLASIGQATFRLTGDWTGNNQAVVVVRPF